MLKPLKQFICDTCGQVIEKPEDGWFEWIQVDHTQPRHSFRIVHHKSASPRKHLEEGCYQHGNARGRSDDHLHNILEHELIHLLYFLDVGPHHDPDAKDPGVQNMREFLEIFRRLTIPYYEEARQYASIAKKDGYFEQANELMVYTEDFLRGLIEKYGD